MIKSYPNTTRIRIINSGDSVGIQINNFLKFFPKLDVTITSSDDARITMFNGEEEIFTANTTDFIEPKETSVNLLVLQIRNIIYTPPPSELTDDEVDAIKGSNNPSASNVFATIADTGGGGGGGQVDSVVAGTNITVDNTDPINPIISASGGGGGTSPSLRNATATDTFSAASETIKCTANTFTVNLPTASGIQGTTYTLVNSGTGIITLDPNGIETINGSLTIDIKRQYTSRTVQSDGTNWIIK